MGFVERRVQRIVSRLVEALRERADKEHLMSERSVAVQEAIRAFADVIEKSMEDLS